MHFWINFIAFQLVWFAAVGGASYGHAWAGPLAFVVFAVAHFAIAPRVNGDLRLLLVASALGALADSLMAASGLAVYAAPIPSAHLAPVWIIALWAGFALTLNHSLAWMTRRPLLAAVLGATLGPLSYLGAGRFWGAVSFGEPLLRSMVVLGVCWFVALLVLCQLAVRWRRRSESPAPSPLMRAP